MIASRGTGGIRIGSNTSMAAECLFNNSNATNGVGYKESSSVCQNWNSWNLTLPLI